MGDCCSDIDQLGCSEIYFHRVHVPPLLYIATPTPTLAEGSCHTAGFTECCPITNPGGCQGEPATCYCDADCYSFGDCCSDIALICISKPTISIYIFIVNISHYFSEPTVVPVENGNLNIGPCEIYQYKTGFDNRIMHSCWLHIKRLLYS